MHTFFRPWASARPVQPAPMIKTFLPSSVEPEVFPRASVSILPQKLMLNQVSLCGFAEAGSLSKAPGLR